MMLKTNKVLIFCVLFSSVVCIAGDSDSMAKQFETLYKKMSLVSLPVMYSESFLDSVKFIEVSESLFSIFDCDDYELYVARLPEYKNVKIIISKVYSRSGDVVSRLYTFLNNKLVDRRYIYGEGETEYNGTIAISLTSFSITNDYNIILKNSVIPEPMNRNEEVNVERKTYIINEIGKIVKK